MSLDIYSASAGSGKTYTLTREYLRWLLSSPSPAAFRSVLAVTFTNKAAEEMKGRILSTLNDLSRGENKGLSEYLCDVIEISPKLLQERAIGLRTAILHDYSHFSVSTIDKFFQKIIRSFMHEAGLLPGFTVELDTDRLLDESIEKLLLDSGEDPLLKQWLGLLVEKRMEEGRHWDIRKDLKTIGREVFKESFHRMGNELREKLNDKTFLSGYIREIKEITSDFEKEMEQIGASALDILKKNGLSINDFKYKGSGFINHFNKITQGDYLPKDRTLEALDNIDKWYGSDASKRGQIDTVFPALNQLLSQAVNLYGDTYVEYNTARQIGKNIYSMGLMADIANNVAKISNDDNLLSINDSLYLLFKLIDNSDTPFIYEKTGAHLHSFMLDEFQDTSAMQWGSLRPLLLNSMAEGGKALVVGDVKQSIYRWRNGDWRILAHQLDEDFQSFDVAHIPLNTNWRSKKAVVETNNKIFEGLPLILQQQLGEAGKNAGLSDSYKDAIQQVATGNKDIDGYVRIENIKNNKEISAKEEILQKLPELMNSLLSRGYNAADIAILVRSNREGQEIANVLLQHRLNITSQDSLFIARSKSVQLITALLHQSVYPNDRVNQYLIDRLTENKNISIAHLSLTEAIEYIIQCYNLASIAEEVPFIQALHDIILQYAGKETNDIYSFVDWWKANGDKQTLNINDDRDAIRILTIHKSKGLQFRVTVIPFCSWPVEPKTGSLLWVGTEQAPFNQIPHLPLNFSKSLADTHFSNDYRIERSQSYIDNLNVLYVALTRAEEELYVFCPETSNNSYTIGNALIELLQADVSEFGLQALTVEKRKNNISPSFLLNDYPSFPYLNHLRLKYRDDIDGTDSSKSLRDYGILMHRAFSLIQTPNDVENAVDTLIQEGFIPNDKETGTQILHELREALAQPGVTNWFDGKRKALPEMEILMPTEGGELQRLRPDRVIIDNNRVEIIDYKFGDKEETEHQKQVAHYASCLHRMGYETVDAYLWYVNKKKITRVLAPVINS